MNERFKMLRKQIGKSQSEFGDLIGVSRDTVANIEGGRIEIKDIYIKSIMNTVSNLNEEWLRTGKGDMFIPLTKNQQILSFFNSVAGLDDDDFKKRLSLAMSEMSEEGWQAIEKFIDSLK